ncbi:hypothetical protein F8M41_017187 [Gigaspora margarita]|uniref:Uncharacterized protein n=1 Tax=Gigaspora margarita TaxID=4874 RepID=A0A8H4B318_GIGMA|nr:hypothetical protein F8M41_017187 [Gigaspora margarita]
MNTKNATALLKILAKNTTKISGLKLGGYYWTYTPELLHALSCIIKSQEQLKQFSLFGLGNLLKFYGIISALEYQKNSLQEFILTGCAYSTEFEVLKNCKNLEILRIRSCNDEKLLKLLNYKIRTLEISGCSIDASIIVQILKESGLLLQRLNFG